MIYQRIALLFFWGAFLLVGYTYVGFPLLLALRALVRPRPAQTGEYTPRVSIIIAAYNEADVIVRKLDNIFGLDYPENHLEVIVASDGSEDGTNALVEKYPAPEVRLLALPHQGKNLTVNAAVAAARNDILVFSDADSMMQPHALRALVAPFIDPQVGGVGGDYRHTKDVEGAVGERTYWGFDRTWKKMQGRAGSMTSATGHIYAIRRSLFRPVPMGVTDDFYISTQAPASHHRLVFEPDAVAYGPIAGTVRSEYRRKVRNITRGLNSVWHMRRVLNPVVYGFYALQVLTHKGLRRLMGIPLLALLVSAPVLWGQSWLYQLATLGQIGLYGAALLGFLLDGTRLGQTRILSLPLYFSMVNIAGLVAVSNLIRGKRYDTWTPERGEAREQPQPSR